MIKKNKATECGVTNGTEGIVVGWIAVKSVYAPKALSGRRRCGKLRTKRRTGDKDETSLASALRAAPLDPVALISGDEDETPQRCGGEDEERPDVESGVGGERT